MIPSSQWLWIPLFAAMGCQPSTEPQAQAPTQPATNEPPPASTAESTGDASGGETPTCASMGGTCVAKAATVACKGQPAGTCPADQFCCQM